MNEVFFLSPYFECKICGNIVDDGCKTEAVCLDCMEKYDKMKKIKISFTVADIGLLRLSLENLADKLNDMIGDEKEFKSDLSNTLKETERLYNKLDVHTDK